MTPERKIWREMLRRCANPAGGGNFTGGDAANTLSVRVWYSVVPALPFGP